MRTLLKAHEPQRDCAFSHDLCSFRMLSRGQTDHSKRRELLIANYSPRVNEKVRIYKTALFNLRISRPRSFRDTRPLIGHRSHFLDALAL